MAKIRKVLWIVFVLQTLIQHSISMYDIYRGYRDTVSNDLTVPIGRKICGDDYCSCNPSATFIYAASTQKGKCVRNDKFLKQSGCIQSSYFTKFAPIQIVHQHDFTAPLSFHILATESCTWNSTLYTVEGENWQPTHSNVGDISVFSAPFWQNVLQIKSPQELKSTFPGMLLKIQIQCDQSSSSASNKCLLLKIEGKTNLTTSPVLPAMPTERSPSRTSTKLVPRTLKTAVGGNTEARKPTSTNNIPDQKVHTNVSEITTRLSTSTTRLSISTTSTPSESQNDARGNDDNDARNLVPILVPILVLFVLLIVLCGAFLYRKRQRSPTRNIDKEFDDENTLPSHATLTKQPHASEQSYAVPGSQINVVAIYDNVSGSTNPNRRNDPNYYEYDYATSDSIPTNPNKNRNPINRPSPQSSHTNPSAGMNQGTCSNKKTESTVNSEDDSVHNGQTSRDPYYFSLEDVSSEHIYDKVTEEPQEHIYNALEKPK